MTALHAGPATTSASPAVRRTADNSGRIPEPEAAMAKVSGTRLPVDVVRDAIQVMGGYGFLREQAASGRKYPLESIWRDCKIGEIYEGANEVQLWSIARVALGRTLTG